MGTQSTIPVRRMRATILMRRVMETQGLKDTSELARYLGKRVAAEGLTDTAASLSISKSTLSYWLLRLGVEIRTQAVVGGKEVH